METICDDDDWHHLFRSTKITVLGEPLSKSNISKEKSLEWPELKEEHVPDLDLRGTGRSKFQEQVPGNSGLDC
jgi:hypothetical protein